MKYTFWGFALIMAGIFGIVFIMMFQSITVDNESEYYVLKEAMEAAMLESVDIACYRSSEQEGCGGVVKISEQKFVENFTRRFVASIGGDVTQYEIEFYDIIESPPKASVVIKGKTKNYNILAEDGSASFDIVNYLDGILIYDYLHERGSPIVKPDESDSNLSVDVPVIDTETEVKESAGSANSESSCVGSGCG